MKKYLLLIILPIFFSGCLFTIGQSQGLCESEECNYREAGICMGVVEIYKNRHNIQNYTVKTTWYGKEYETRK